VVAVQEEGGGAHHLHVHVRIARVGGGTGQRRVDLDVGGRIERLRQAGALLDPRAVGTVGEARRQAAGRHLRQPVGRVPGERAGAVRDHVAVGVVADRGGAEQHRRVRARRRRNGVCEGLTACQRATVSQLSALY